MSEKRAPPPLPRTCDTLPRPRRLFQIKIAHAVTGMGTCDMMLMPEDESSTREGEDGSVFRTRKYRIVGGYGLKTQIKNVEKTPFHEEIGRKFYAAIDQAWKDDVANPGQGVVDFHQVADIQLGESDMNTIQDAGYTAKGTHQTAEKQAEEAAKAAVQKAAKRRSKG